MGADMQKPSENSDYSQAEAEQRRDDLLHAMLKTPPKPRPQREREPVAEPTQIRGKRASGGKARSVTRESLQALYGSLRTPSLSDGPDDA